MAEWSEDVWTVVLGIVGVVALLVSAGLTAHAVLHKRDDSAAVAWVALIWLSPYLGPIAYVLLGINRIRRRASRLRPERSRISTGNFRSGREVLGPYLSGDQRHLENLASLIDKIAEEELTTGNAVTPLINGDMAYPEMIRAIDGAERSVALGTYIFKDDVAGKRFVDALDRAARRGVAVRVLIDGVGSHYSIPSVVPALRKRGVPVARFLHSFMPWKMPFLNLRNHQKILVVDSRIGFTGGMNIREEHLLAEAPRAAVEDIHFRVDGPVVGHLIKQFAEDWSFTTDELLDGEAWRCPAEPAGSIVARGVTAGPDHRLDGLHWIFLGAVEIAQVSIKVVTPYFLPDRSMITALSIAATSGVGVDIVLPAKNNLAFVKWASMSKLEYMMRAGCRIWLSPPPFDHSKLMVIDQSWALLGSTNWDPRSLRLNFEFNLECYDRDFAERMDQLIGEKIKRSSALTLADLEGRSFPVKLRDGLARLFTPYL